MRTVVEFLPTPCLIDTNPGRKKSLPSHNSDGKKNPSGDNSGLFSVSGSSTDDLGAIALASAKRTEV